MLGNTFWLEEKAEETNKFPVSMDMMCEGVILGIAAASLPS